MDKTKEELDKALDSLIEKSKRTDERLQAIREAGQAARNGLDAGLQMTRGRWCNHVYCPSNKMNWCERGTCPRRVRMPRVSLTPDITQEPDFAKAEMDFKQVDPLADAKPSDLIQKILMEVEKLL